MTVSLLIYVILTVIILLMIGNATVNQTFILPTSFFAATTNYDCAAYGAGNYNDSSLCTTQAPNTGVAPSSTATAGFPVWSVAGLALGVVLIISGIIILVKKRASRSSAN